MDLDDLDSVDTAVMTVMAAGKPTAWLWTFAGPAHERGLAQQARIARESNAERKAREQAQVNMKKWKARDVSADEVKEDNINFVLERLLTWSDNMTVGGEPFTFSPENARKVLADPKKSSLLQQSIEFILDDQSFTKRSVTS